MSLSNDLISQFVKITKDTNKRSDKEPIVYGTIVEQNDRIYAKLDGSESITPVTTTTDVKNGERVMVTIKNHQAIVTGNISSPSARTVDVKVVNEKVTEFENVSAHKVTAEQLSAITATIDNLKAKTAQFTEMSAVTAEIETLRAKFATLDKVSAKEMEVIEADIENLRVKLGEFDHISTDNLEAMNADIDALKAYTADFTYVSADVLAAMKAEIDNLDTKKLSAEDAKIHYAAIDFANIKMAAIVKLFTQSGIIKDLVVGDQSITGELVGVTIKGDLIEANTLKADKLVVKGSDGLFYKLNVAAGGIASGEPVPTDSLHGSAITAKSIVAEKIAVDDLVAFGATIGGFKIGNKSIYSGVKESIENATAGVYLDSEGQMSIGDGRCYVKFFKNSDGQYKLDIVAGSVYVDPEEVIVTDEQRETLTEFVTGLKAKVSSFDSDAAALGDLAEIETDISALERVDSDYVDNLISIIESIKAGLLSLTDISTEDLDSMIADADAIAAYVSGLLSSRDLLSKVIESESQIKMLSDSIRMLVTDGNGGSLMTQTKDGWTFSTAQIQENITNVSDGLAELTDAVGDVGDAVDILKQSLDDISELAEYIKIGTYEDEPCIELGEGDSDFKLFITNTRMMFMEGSNVIAHFNNNSLHIKKAVIEEELQQGGFVWKARKNGNVGLMWKGVSV
jgi:hypothetical protein